MPTYVPTTRSEASSTQPNRINPASQRDLLTLQTGKVLVELGNLFINVPPFSDYVDEHTGKLLISIGKKLRTKK